MAFVQSTWACSSTLLLLLLLTAQFPGVLCEDTYNIGGLVAACAVSLILLFVVIAMIGIGFTWNSWYPKQMWARDKVKMPRAYWRKKEDAKLRLLNSSFLAASESGLPGGNTTSRVRDTEDNKSDKASWIQGWNDANLGTNKTYEEMGLMMELGAEKPEEEFRIETTVVDDEVLELGPFNDPAKAPVDTSTAKKTVKDTGKDTSTDTAAGPSSVVVTGFAEASTSRKSNAGSVKATGGGQVSRQPDGVLEMTEEPDSPMYATVDRSTKSRGDKGGDPLSTSERVTTFSKSQPYLVAL